MIILMPGRGALFQDRQVASKRDRAIEVRPALASADPPCPTCVVSFPGRGPSNRWSRVE